MPMAPPRELSLLIVLALSLSQPTSSQGTAPSPAPSPYAPPSPVPAPVPAVECPAGWSRLEYSWPQHYYHAEPYYYGHYDEEPAHDVEEEEEMTSVSYTASDLCYKDMGRVNNSFSECKKLCQEAGGGLPCIKNYGMLESLLWAFSSEAGILLANTEQDSCTVASNMWYGYYSQEPSFYAEDCGYVDPEQRCVCQSVAAESCEAQLDWHWDDMWAPATWDDWGDYSWGGYYDDSWWWGHHYYGEEEVNLYWHPEFVSLLLFGMFLAGTVSVYILSKLGSVTYSKVFAIAAFVCALITLGCIGLAMFAARGYYRHDLRPDIVSLVACAAGGFIALVASIMDLASCCQRSCLKPVVSVLYGLAAHFSALNFFAMCVDATHSACPHGGGRHTCTVKILEIVVATFSLLQAFLLAFMCRKHGWGDAPASELESRPSSSMTTAAAVYLAPLDIDGKPLRVVPGPQDPVPQAPSLIPQAELPPVGEPVPPSIQYEEEPRKLDSAA